MDYKNLKNLIATINRANIKGDHRVSLPIKEAQAIQHEITLLLLELKKDNNGPTIIDGGTFQK